MRATEAEGVIPVYCGENARESAESYARQRAGYGHAEIQVLDDAWNVAETIDDEQAVRMSSVHFVLYRNRGN